MVRAFSHSRARGKTKQPARGAARQYHQSEGPEIRRPKAEARRKAEDRNPKQPFPRPVADMLTRRAIRASRFGFLSGFGLRASGLAGSQRVVVFRCARRHESGGPTL